MLLTTDYLNGVYRDLVRLENDINECRAAAIPVVNAGDKLRYAFVFQRGRIYSNFLNQAGWLEKVGYYLGFKSLSQDVQRAELGIASASQLAEFLADTKRILAKYKAHIIGFEVPTFSNGTKVNNVRESCGNTFMVPNRVLFPERWKNLEQE